MTDTNPIDYATDPATHFETPHANQRRDTLEHVHVRNTDEPDELFVIPEDATEAELATVWMQATGDGFADLADWR